MTDPRTDAPVVEQPGDELLEEVRDDAVIGRAFRWSLAVIIIVGGLIALTVWLIGRPDPAAPLQNHVLVQPRTQQREVDSPAAAFTDVTKQAGVDFVHFNGAIGEKLLPETMGGGCAFLDYDNDGDQDILLVNSAPWPNATAAQLPPSPPTHALYRNDGAGRFTNVTKGSGLDVSFYGMGPAVGDIDNDGDADVFISAVGSDRLFINESGRFQDVTVKADVAGDPASWSTGSGFFDYDRDGDLDLFVVNYVKWSRDIDFAVDYQLTGVGRAYGPPNNFEGTNNSLFRNNGDGTFTDVSESAGIHVKNLATGRPMGKGLGLVFADIDRDGWLDIFVANDTVQRFCFRNNRDGTFTECGASSGVGFDRNGNATGAMGVDAAFYRNDDALAFVIGNFANEMSSLLVSQRDPRQFTDDAIVEGIGAPTRTPLKFGTFFFDYDLDGREDILHANGHIEDEINKVQPSQQYRQSGQLFWNAGPDHAATFAVVGSEKIGGLEEKIVGRGAAFADIDSDGDLDVLLTQIAGPPLLLRNDQKLGHHWLRVKLRGVRANRDAIGAMVELTADGITQRRCVMPTRSYLSQVELPIMFGLGKSEKVDALRITWPDGSVQQVTPPRVDQVVEIVQEAPKA
jgi:hypothetical protein